MQRRKLTETEANEYIRKLHEYNVNNALLWFKFAAADLKTPADPMRRRQPKISRHMSREQRIVSTQTKNPIAAAYGTESDWNRTPIIEDPEKHTLTREVGPNDRFNANANYRTGKATNTANGEGNKRMYRGRRAYGGGNNRKSLEELMNEYDL